jgi:hypothetical protein
MPGKINITELDFDSIKTNLKIFLQGQTQFSDYDFDGSGLDVILDLLAYNTHYNAIYASFVGNEMFLDSADKRNSVVSLAKHLGYTPASRVSSKALLDITLLPAGSPTNVIILKNTSFTSVKDGVTYTFSTLNDLNVPNNSGNYIATGVQIFEGERLTFNWTVTSTATQKFIIPNTNIDLNTLSVSVQNSSSDTTTNSFERAGNVNAILNTTKVYWPQEVDEGKYEIVFGNGVVGFPLQIGNIVKIEYIVSSAEIANSISYFTATGAIGGLTAPNVSFVTNTASVGGAERESNESIKFLAPRNFSTQDRAVTITDYQNILLAARPDIETITGWGGQDAVPPQYGRVFLAIKPIGLDKYSESEKQNIIATILKQNNVVSITPIIVDPDLTYFNITTTVNYNSSTINDPIGTIQTQVETAINDYFNNTLNIFGETFRFSILTRNIDNANQAILNNQTSVALEKRHKPVLGQTFNKTFSFNNPIKPGTLTTNKHTVGALTGLQLDDDGAGLIRRVMIDGQGVKTIIAVLPATIDYTAGTVVLEMRIDGYESGDDRLKLFVTPANQNIIPLREQVLTIDENDASSLSVTLISETI